jgi:hypothetical protein
MGLSFIVDLRSFFGAPAADPSTIQTSHSSE